MNKEMFLQELDRLLSDLSQEEKQEAMTYYEEYFLEAGAQKEAQALRELGSPQEVSYRIHDELTGKELACIEPSEAETGQRARENREWTGQKRDKWEKPQGSAPRESEKKKEGGINGWKIACIVLLCMIGFPIVIPLAVGLLVAALAIAAAMFAVLFAFVVTILALLVSAAVVAVVFFVLGVTRLLTAPFAALILLGLSFVLAGVFLLGGWVLIKLCVVVIPVVAKAIWRLLCLPFRKKEGAKV